MIKLSERLQASVSYLAEKNCVADVGCDHAYASIYLVQSGRARRCIAMDVREGPLAKARENIEKYNCSSQIEMRLSDGLNALKPGEADCVLIAGMGGALMERILCTSLQILSGIGELVLQPQSEWESLRRCLHKIGFCILDETMVFEDGKYYVSIYARNTERQESYQERIEYLFGKLLLDRGDPVLCDYLYSRLLRNQEILRKMEEYGKHRDDQDIQEILQKISYIQKGMDCIANDKNICRFR